MIVLLCEASATFCARLERIAVENELGANTNVLLVAAEQPPVEPHESKTSAATNSPLATAESAATVEIPSSSSRPGESDTAAQRAAMVEQFQRMCKETIPVRITKKHIWRSAGHTTSRQFQYWLAGEDRVPGSRSTRGATAEDKRNFRRILTMKPGEFYSLLQEKRIIPATKS